MCSKTGAARDQRVACAPKVERREPPAAHIAARADLEPNTSLSSNLSARRSAGRSSIGRKFGGRWTWPGPVGSLPIGKHTRAAHLVDEAIVGGWPRVDAIAGPCRKRDAAPPALYPVTPIDP